jgi:hypothetical protein
MYLDETPVVALVTLVNDFCTEQQKYFKFGTNHWALFKALRKNDGHIETVGARIGVEFKKNRAPQELVDAVQTFLLPKKKADQAVRQMLEQYLEFHCYRAKYALTNTEQLQREFARFQAGLVRFINQAQRKNGIKMLLSRPSRK